jgi:peptide deformylase
MKEIVQDGAAVLRDQAKPVPEDLFGSVELARIIDDMKAALDPELEGVALAAPQIGVPYRIFIVRTDRTIALPPSEDSDPQDIPKAQNDIYINPEIIKTSRRRAAVDEGCLSTRGIYGTTLRHERATVRARNSDGSTFERGAGGLLAQIFQHEIDHLNGILFIDHAQELVTIPQ